MEALTGEVLADRADAVAIDGEAMGRAGPTRRRLAGAAFVPEERNGHAAVGELTLSENIILAHHAAEGVATRSWIDFGKASDWAKRVRETFDVRAGSENPIAGSLSGGNLQKFVVGGGAGYGGAGDQPGSGGDFLDLRQNRRDPPWPPLQGTSRRRNDGRESGPANGRGASRGH
jgi:hypothetical protein